MGQKEEEETYEVLKGEEAKMERKAVRKRHSNQTRDVGGSRKKLDRS